MMGTNQGKIVHIERVGNPNKKFSHEIKFLAPPVGSYNFDIYVKSNAYVGFDHKEQVSLTTLDNSVLPEYKIHPDDAELDDEPTLWEEMLNANIEEDDSDSDDDDSDDEGPAIAPKSDAELKKERLQKARQQTDDSDSDEEAEEVYAQK